MNLQCAECNVDHPYHGLRDGDMYRSKFECLILEAIKGVCPDGMTFKREFNVPNSDSTNNCPFKIDCVITLPDKVNRFAIEVDGMDHYPDGVRQTLQDPVRQLSRDQYVEQFCLRNGMSIFRVPYTFKSKKKLQELTEYVFAAAQKDVIDSTPRVHYLDYEKTYIDIDEFAFHNDGVQFIRAVPNPLCPSVYTWPPN